jgi:hypothetical protein
MTKDSERPVYCASEAAIKAATLAYGFGGITGRSHAPLADALIAAHHPNLGLDRSVCLRDVVEVLRSMSTCAAFRTSKQQAAAELAEFIEREFGADA